MNEIPEIVTVLCSEIKLPSFTSKQFSHTFWENGYKTDKFYKRSVIITDPDFGKPYPLSPYKTEICLGRDKKFLYIGVKCFDNQKEKIKFTHLENQSEVHLDDSIELFFDINHSHNEYYQLIVNGAGYYSSYYRGKNRRKKFWQVNVLTKPLEIENGWGVEIAIDIASFKKKIKRSSIWGFNAGRNFSTYNWEDRVPASLSPLHYQAWDVPSRFADMYFKENGIFLKDFLINGESVFFNDENLFLSPELTYGKNKLKVRIKNSKKKKIEIITKIGQEKENVFIKNSGLSYPFRIEKIDEKKQRTVEIILKGKNRIFFRGKWDVKFSPLVNFKPCILFPEKNKILLNADIDFLKDKKIIVENKKTKKIFTGKKEIFLKENFYGKFKVTILNKEGEVLTEKTFNLQKPPSYLKIPYSSGDTHPSIFRIGPSLKEKIKGDRRLKKIYEKIKKEVDNFIENPTPLPLQSSASLTFYRCFKHGARLINLGNGKHKCPVDEEILKNKLLDYSYLFWQHSENFATAVFSAFLYLIDKKSKYLKTAKKILLFYSKNYDKFQYNNPLIWKNIHSGRIRDSILVESDLITLASFTFDMIYNHLNKEERKTIIEKMLIPICEKMVKYHGGKGNWKTHLNLALVSSGIVLKNPYYIQAGIGKERGFLFDMEKCVTKGGFWHQGAIGYHFYALHPYVQIAEIISKTYQVNLYKNRKFQKMFLAPVLFSFPDGSFPNIGTGGGGKISDFSSIYEIAAEKVPLLKPFLSYLAKFLIDNEGENGLFILTGDKNLKKEKYKKESKPLPSVNFSEIGYGILRDGKEKVQQIVFVYGKTHPGKGQPDKLSFSLFGDNKLLAPDPGYLSYTNPLTPSWYYRTIAHNTVVVDFKNQDYGKAPFLCYFDGEIKIIGAVSNEIYPDIESTRIMLLKNNILIDFFVLKGKKKHTFDYFIHHYGKIKIDGKFKKFSEPVLQYGGYQHIKNVRKSKNKKNLWKVEWTLEDKSKTISHLFSFPRAEIYSGDGPRYGGDIKSKKEIKPIPLIFLRNEGEYAAFSFIMEVGVKKEKIKDVKFSKGKKCFSINYGKDKIKIYNNRLEYNEEKISFKRKIRLFSL